MLNQAIVVARLSFHHVQPKQTPWDRDFKISKQHCTIGMPSGGSNENTRTRSNFRDVPDQTVTSSSEVMTADFFFCITNLGTPCILSSLTSAAGCLLLFCLLLLVVARGSAVFNSI